LLSFYQLWLDDLFPKAKFLDALAMVEKAGHKKQVMTARNDMIQEGKPKDPEYNEQAEEDDIFGENTGPRTVEVTAPPASEVQRPKTPDPHDIPSDEDLYDATPRSSRPIVPVRNEDEPDADDLEALMAEADGQDQSRDARPVGHGPNADDLDALIVEAENNDQTPHITSKPTIQAGATTDDFADEEAAMQEMEGLW
jgi:replication fork protection complex subunit Csm3/Swi3